MSRQRLSWDEKKVAEIAKQADPYTMNQTRSNPPAEKYKNWDTETGGEGVDTRTPWKTEGRTETGHPAPEREAVMAARKLEDKALKCITIAQRMLPGAVDAMIEEQATDLMYLPEKCILATLQRQVKVAEVLAKGPECKDEEEAEEAEEGSEATAAKEEKEEKPAEEEKPADAPAAPVQAKEEKEEKPAEEEKPADAPAAPVQAKKEEKPVEEEKPTGEDVSASDDLLDLILFDDAQTKTGAKKLSGIVKQASAGDVTLDSLWDAPPDVSKAFR